MYSILHCTVLNRSYIWHFKCDDVIPCICQRLWDLWMCSLERLRDVKGNSVVLQSLNACTCDCKPLEKYNRVELFTTHRVMPYVLWSSSRSGHWHFNVWQILKSQRRNGARLGRASSSATRCTSGANSDSDAGRLKFLCFPPRAKVCRSVSSPSLGMWQPRP